MYDFKKILFPVDFSKCNEKVFPYARNMAKKYKAKLFLIFVARDLSHFKRMHVNPLTLHDVAAGIAEGGEKAMKAFCKRRLSRFKNYETIVVVGDAATEICKFSEEKDVDLIILCTHGRRGLNRTLLGSVADRIIKRAKRPVLSINPFKMKLL